MNEFIDSTQNDTSGEVIINQNGTEDRYWIKPGIRVKVGSGSLEVTVDKVVFKRTNGKPGADGEPQYIKRIVGVLCHWVDKDDKYQTGMFHTKELIKIS